MSVRLQIVSDLHLEFQADLTLDIEPDIDALIVAGDICSGTERGFAFVREQAGPELPIIAVAGNHEFYGRDWYEERSRAREVAPRFGIHWLDDDATEIAGVRFLGATLWTDYAFFGADTRDQAMRAAGLGMSDHIMIGAGREPDRRFSPYHARDAHLASREFLETRLATPFRGPTVVVTHHGPHERSVAPKFRGSIITAAFISDLSEVIDAHQPRLWVHGHTHVNFDYAVGRTRVLCNPYGYPGENSHFDPRLVVAV